YGMFSKHGFDRLEFLSVPDVIYRYMVEASGQSNRRMVNYYRETLSLLNYNSQLYITSVSAKRSPEPWPLTLKPGIHFDDEDLAQIRKIRPRLLNRYRTLTDADLLISGVFLVARKPS